MPQKPKKPAPGNPTPPDDDPDDDGGDDEAPLTRGDVTKMINGAVRSQLGRMLAPAIQEGLKPVLEQLSSLKPANDEDDDDLDGDEAPSKKANPQLNKALKEIETLKRQSKEREDKLAAAETAQKSSRIDGELTRALTEAGVDKHRLAGALALKRSSAFVDDAGAVKYKVKRDGYDEDLEPAAALKEWASTDEGKSYLAPSGSTGGSGARPPRGQGAQRKAADGARTDLKAEAAAALPALIDQMIGGGGGFTI